MQTNKEYNEKMTKVIKGFKFIQEDMKSKQGNHLWKMGLYPVGILKDKKFHIYYVPLKKGESK
jgi:hypothetical protein